MIKNKINPILVFFLLLLGMACFSYIPIMLFDIPYETFDTKMSLLYSLYCDVGFIMILGLIYSKVIVENFKSYFKNFRENFEYSFKYYFAGLLIMIGSNLIITLFFKNAIAGNEELVRSAIDDFPLYMVFSVSIYAPFVEELIFRHSIRDCVRPYKQNKLTKFIYVFISGFVFALLHILGTAQGLIDYIFIIPYMSLGVAFALLYYNTNNIWSSILMHAFHNTITIILYLSTGGMI